MLVSTWGCDIGVILRVRVSEMSRKYRLRKCTPGSLDLNPLPSGHWLHKFATTFVTFCYFLAKLHNWVAVIICHTWMTRKLVFFSKFLVEFSILLTTCHCSGDVIPGDDLYESFWMSHTTWNRCVNWFIGMTSLNHFRVRLYCGKVLRVVVLWLIDMTCVNARWFS